jgi:hypothetical protein
MDVVLDEEFEVIAKSPHRKLPKKKKTRYL